MVVVIAVVKNNFNQTWFLSSLQIRANMDIINTIKEDAANANPIAIKIYFTIFIFLLF